MRFAHLPPEDVTTIHGLPVTTITRTLIDLAGDLERTEAVRITRQALDKGLISLDELRHAAEKRTDLESIEAFRDVVRRLESQS